MQTEEDGDKLNSFVAISGETAATAHHYLDATGGNLEQAVELYFNSQGATAISDEDIARRMASDSVHASVPAADGPMEPRASQSDDVNWDENEVRAPIPIKRDRLYGDDSWHTRQDRAQALRPPSHEVSAFRDFEAEGSRHSQKEKRTSKSRLGEMFEPPRSLIFQGVFEDAKTEAREKSMWLLVNIQSNTEFASHQLNRDTWRDSTMQDIVRTSFLFVQYHDTAPEGQKIQNYYRLRQLPAILVVDPLTGSAMRAFSGFVGAERLMEELVPFLDAGPDDPGAQYLGQSRHKRRSSGIGARAKGPTEEEELQMALAMSIANAPEDKAVPERVEEIPAGSSADKNNTDTQQQLKAAPEASTADNGPEKAPADIQAKALASLPPQPSSEGECRVAFRLPDGSRVQRIFPKNAQLHVLRTFCIASSMDAASGKEFALKEARPGAPLIEDLSQTLEEAGLANSLVSMSWLQ